MKPLKELVKGIYHSLPPWMKNLVDGEMPQEEVARHIEKAREFAESIGYPAQSVRVPRVRIHVLSRGDWRDIHRSLTKTGIINPQLGQLLEYGRTWSTRKAPAMTIGPDGKRGEYTVFIEKDALSFLMHEQESEWEKQLWTNILRHALGRTSKEQLLKQYADDYAIAELTVTKPHVLRRVKTLNEGTRPDKQIKPYNFVLVGSPTMVSNNGEPIIPLTQFTSEYGQAPYQPFVNAKRGRLHEENTELYWKTVDKLVEEYIDHPETKFENGHRDGTMRRRHLLADSIHYIGKESNELEETEALGVDDDTYVEYRKLRT